MNDKVARIKALFCKNSALFSALGDPTRQQILLLMADNQHLSVGEITKFTKLSRPAVSHHLKILKDARLVTQHMEGTRRYYHPTFRAHVQPLRALVDEVALLDKTKKGAV